MILRVFSTTAQELVVVQQRNRLKINRTKFRGNSVVPRFECKTRNVPLTFCQINENLQDALLAKLLCQFIEPHKGQFS